MLSVICRNRSILRPHRFLTVTLALIFLVLSHRAGSAAVTLIEFKADTVDSATNRVSWRTGSEIGTVGFIIWRGGSIDGPWQRLTTLPAEGDSISGASYSFDDANLGSPAQAWYKLQELANQGNVCFGPAAPGQGSHIDITPCPSDATATMAPTATPTATPQPSATPSPRASPTRTATPLPTATPSATLPPTSTPTTQPAALITPSLTPVIGPTRSPTATLISVILVTATPSATLRASPTPSPTPAAQATHPEPTPTEPAEPAATLNPTPAELVTSTPSATPVYSPTPWASPTPVFPATFTPPANPTPTASFILLPSPTPFPDRSTSSLPTVFLLVGLGSLGGAAALGFVAWRNYKQKPPAEGP